jgi:hypothetical protein
MASWDIRCILLPPIAHRPSAAGLALHPAYRARQQHPIMREADDLNHAIRPQAVNDNVSGAPHALIPRDQTTPEAQRVNSDASDRGGCLRASRFGAAPTAANTDRISRS